MQNNLKALRTAKNLTLDALAAKSGLGKSTIGNFENGRTNMSMDGLKILADVLKVPVEEILKQPMVNYGGMRHRPIDLAMVFKEENVLAKIEMRKVPVVSWTAAGKAHDYEDLTNQIDQFVETSNRDPNAFALIVEGDSMETEIHAGDIVIFSPNNEPRNGDVVVARLQEDGVMLKKYQRTGTEGSIIKLISINPAYPPKEFPRSAFRFIYPAVELKRQLRR